MICLDLSPEEKAHVEQARRTRPQIAERCHYVLLNAEGWSVPQIARRLDRNGQSALRADSKRGYLCKHGQNISYLDAEIIGSYFEEMFQTSRRLVWPLWSVSPRHLGKFLAQNKIRLFPHWRNACPGQVS